MQSTLIKVTRVEIKAARKKVMDAVRKDGGGGYVTDGRKWLVKTYLHEHEGDQDILLEGEGRISMNKLRKPYPIAENSMYGLKAKWIGMQT